MRQQWLLPLGALALSASVGAVTTTRVSTDASGQQATVAGSFAADIDASGTFIVFSSAAANLVATDSNGLSDIFLKNRLSGAITLISRNTLGASATGVSNAPSISADGLFVAFNSAAADLVAGDNNGRTDIFVYSVASSTIERISVNSAAVEGNGQSVGTPAISANGRFIAFESFASNLSVIDSDVIVDIFLRDRQTSSTVLLSQTSGGALGSGPLGSNRPTINADGRYIAFESSRVLVADDDNFTGDIYLRDTQAGTTIRVNSSASGVFPTAGFSGRPSLAASGRLIAFRSLSDTLVPNDGTSLLRDIFIKNLDSGAITRVTAPGQTDPNSDSNELHLSATGNALVFHSLASNFSGDDTNGRQDIFRLTIASGAIERISLASSGAQADDQSGFPRSNENGSVAAYESSATNLVGDDSNGRLDVFATVIPSDLIFRDGFEG